MRYRNVHILDTYLRRPNDFQAVHLSTVIHQTRLTDNELFSDVPMIHIWLWFACHIRSQVMVTCQINKESNIRRYVLLGGQYY